MLTPRRCRLHMGNHVARRHMHLFFFRVRVFSRPLTQSAAPATVPVRPGIRPSRSEGVSPQRRSRQRHRRRSTASPSRPNPLSLSLPCRRRVDGGHVGAQTCRQQNTTCALVVVRTSRKSTLCMRNSEIRWRTLTKYSGILFVLSLAELLSNGAKFEFGFEPGRLVN